MKSALQFRYEAACKLVDTLADELDAALDKVDKTGELLDLIWEQREGLSIETQNAIHRFSKAEKENDSQGS